jgi:hypothetical protein
MKNAVLLDVTPCGSCENRYVGETYRIHHQGEKNQRATELTVTANVVPSWLILFTLIMQTIVPPKRPFLQEATRRHIPEGGILHTHSNEKLKSHMIWNG